jgi:SAM-dependent methyltransferase
MGCRFDFLMNTYSKFAAVYDAIYSFKNYEAEALRIHAIVSDRKRSPGNAMLDVACGTGGHMRFLRNNYTVEGLDTSERMLDIARAHFPDLKFFLGDMVSFDLGRQFDAIVCLFSAIGYAKTLPKMRQAILRMRHHLLPGGVLIVEPWFPKGFQHAGVHSLFVDKPDLKIARIDIPVSRNDQSIINFHMMVGTPDGIEHFTEKHVLGLFSHEEYLAAFRDAGLEVSHDEKGLMGRGLYIGVNF